MVHINYMLFYLMTAYICNEIYTALTRKSLMPLDSTVLWLVLLLCIWWVSHMQLSYQTGYSDRSLVVFLSYFRHMLGSICTPTTTTFLHTPHYLLFTFILSFDIIQSVLRIAEPAMTACCHSSRKWVKSQHKQLLHAGRWFPGYMGHSV
jgi:hypothetical protein